MRSRLLDLETVGLHEANAWLDEDPITAPSNYKDEQAIADYIAKGEAKRIERFALDPDCCRIVALGYHDIGLGDPTVHLCSNEFEEREQLKLFWDSYRTTETRLIGFNSFRFDLPVIVMRSIYLNVKHPVLTFAPAWKAYPHVDLWEKLSLNGARKDVKSLRFYAKRFGIPIYDDISGKDVAAMVKAGEWEKVHNHCMFDLDLTRALAERLGVLATTTVAA
jgi:predicted PolB exonuclease-like 3'-5' exonuclease